MEDKEKLIEEMAKDIHEELETYHGCDFMAQRLIKKGWIKPTEDRIVQPTIQSYSTHDNDLVVISRKEYERLSSSHDIVFCDNKECPDNLLCRCCEISECPKNIPEYNEKLSANKHKLELFQKLCKERERANGYEDRYRLLEEELKQSSKETAEKIWNIAKIIVDSTKHIVQGREYLHINALKEIIKSCGVEIKE